MLAILNPFWLYRDIYWVLAGNWISERNKSFDFFTNFWETRRLRRSRGRRRGFCKTRFNTIIVPAEHQSLICYYFCFLFSSVSLSPPDLPSFFSFFLLIFLFHILAFTTTWMSNGNLKWDGKWKDLSLSSLFTHTIIWPSEKTSIHTYGLGLRSRAIPRVLHGVQ